MAAKGNEAKQNLLKRMEELFGKDYVGYDAAAKKFYIWSREDGVRTQVALAMTVPKTPYGGESTMMDFSDNKDAAAPQLGESEQETLNRLMKELGL